MRCITFIVAAACLAAGLLAGRAGAGEDDILALRGDAGDGRIRTNAFHASWRREAEAPAASGAGGYLEWKNNCVPLEPVVAGKTVDLRSPDGFGQVPPYLKTDEADGPGYTQLLADELSEAGWPAPGAVTPGSRPSGTAPPP